MKTHQNQLLLLLQREMLRLALRPLAWDRKLARLQSRGLHKRRSKLKKIAKLIKMDISNPSKRTMAASIWRSWFPKGYQLRLRSKTISSPWLRTTKMATSSLMITTKAFKMKTALKRALKGSTLIIANSFMTMRKIAQDLLAVFNMPRTSLTTYALIVTHSKSLQSLAQDVKLIVRTKSIFLITTKITLPLLQQIRPQSFTMIFL